MHIYTKFQSTTGPKFVGCDCSEEKIFVLEDDVYFTVFLEQMFFVDRRWRILF